MFGNKKATKKNFYEYVINNKDSVEKYLPILANAIYDQCISENTKKTLGIKQFYVNDDFMPVRLNEEATNVDTAIAYNELTDLIDKTIAFTALFKDDAYANYHQFVEVLIDKNTKAGEAKKKPVIVTIDDVVEGIKKQPAKEHNVFTDEKIANGSTRGAAVDMIERKMSLLEIGIKNCLVSVTFGMKVNSD